MKSFLTTQLIGRRPELDLLNDVLDAVRRRTGRAVLVQGEPGIGKSRLVAEIQSRAVESGYSVLIGRCFEQDKSYPYAPMIDLLRPLLSREPLPDWFHAHLNQAQELTRLLPALAARLPQPSTLPSSEPDLEKFQLFEALTAFFLHQAGTGPLLMVVEDLHWCDQASLEFILHLVRRIAAAPVLLLLTYRNTGGQAGLEAFLSELDRDPIAQELRLDPLSRMEVSQLIQSILGQPSSPSSEFVDTVFKLTEGNPFFTEEICTSLISSGDIYYIGEQWRRKPLAQIEIPGSLQRLVELRLRRISQPARQLIDTAAVSGRSFDFTVLQAVTGRGEGELLALVKELVAAQLVVEESADQFAFRHALTREALYGRILGRERQALHGQLCQAIEKASAGALEDHLEELAYHTYEAGWWSKALDYGQRAGAKALAVFAPSAAVDHLTRAVEAAQQLTQAVPAALHRLRGQAFDILGDFENARQDYESALETAQSSGDSQTIWQTLLDLGLLWASHDYERTGEYCRQALALAREMDDPKTIGHSLNRLGNWLMNHGQFFKALETHQEALGRFEALQDRAGMAETLDLLAMTSNMCGDAAGTVAYYRRAVPLLRELNNRQTLASSLTMLANYTLDEGMVREAVDISRAIGWRSGEAYALIYQGNVQAYHGDFGGGLQAIQNGLDLALAIDHRQWQCWGFLILGMIHTELLAFDTACSDLRRSLELAQEVGSSFMLDFARGLLATALLSAGRTTEAATLLPEKLSEPVMTSQFSLVKAYVEWVLDTQGPAQALEALDQLPLPGPEHWLGAMAYYHGLAFTLRARLLALLDRQDQAEHLLQQILDLYQSQDVRMGRWRIHLDLGKIYRARGDIHLAERAFTAARNLVLEAAHTLTDPGLRERFRQRAGVMIPPARQLTPRQIAKAESGGLTRRERQVAVVVAQGLSNQEIAEELVVSIKTVEAHVSRILSKLDFSSRAQIAAWAVETGLTAARPDLENR